MSIITKIEIPEDILLSLRESEQEFGLEMKRTIAVRYYDEKKLSLGQCCELAEMTEYDFIKYLSGYKISIFRYDSDNELLEDINNA